MRQQTLALYGQVLDVEDIATERNFKPVTIMNHLTELAEAGEAIDIERSVQPEHYEAIVDALYQNGDDLLRPVNDFLVDEYSYEGLRLFKTAIRRAHRFTGV